MWYTLSVAIHWVMLGTICGDFETVVRCGVGPTTVVRTPVELSSCGYRYRGEKEDFSA